MEVIIRKAVVEDCPSMFGLIKELAHYEKASTELTVSLEDFELAGFGSNPVWWGFVAEHPKEGILGMAICYIRYSTWKGKCLYLEDFFVKEAYRKCGIGKKIFDAVIEEGKKNKFVFMNWQVLEWNESAINFYKKYKASLDSEWINCNIPLT